MTDFIIVFYLLGSLFMFFISLGKKDLITAFILAVFWPLVWFISLGVYIADYFDRDKKHSGQKTFEELFHELRQKEKDAMNDKGDWPYELDYKGDKKY